MHQETGMLALVDAVLELRAQGLDKATLRTQKNGPVKWVLGNRTGTAGFGFVTETEEVRHDA